MKQLKDILLIIVFILSVIGIVYFILIEFDNSIALYYDAYPYESSRKP